MKGIFPRILLFVIAVEALYTFIGMTMPQQKSLPPPTLAFHLGMDVDDLVKMGREIVTTQKGNCLICHTIGPSPGAKPRCPDLAGVGERAGKRRPGYTGEQYLMESLLDPGAYVVEGYGKIMPRADQPPISLNPAEIKAAMAFLQSLGGEVTVKLTKEDLEKKAAGAAAVTPEQKERIERGDSFFHGVDCLTCHSFRGQGPGKCPDLTRIGAMNSPDYIRESIVNPNAKIVQGYKAGVMPVNYATRFSKEEIEDLVAFLSAQKGEVEASGKDYAFWVVLGVGILAFMLDVFTHTGRGAKSNG